MGVLKSLMLVGERERWHRLANNTTALKATAEQSLLVDAMFQKTVKLLIQVWQCIRSTKI